MKSFKDYGDATEMLAVRDFDRPWGRPAWEGACSGEPHKKPESGSIAKIAQMQRHRGR